VNITGVQKGHYFGKHHKCEEIIAMRELRVQRSVN
jgi:hypothetical protein